VRGKRHAYERVAAWATLGIVSLLIVFFGVGLTFAGSGDKIADGVKIGGVDVGGLSAEAAERALRRLTPELARRQLVVHVGKRSLTLTASQLGVDPDWQAAVRSARALGDGFGPFRGFRRLYLKVAGAEVMPSARVSEAAVDAWLSSRAEQVDTRPRNAAVKLRGLQPVIIPGRTGRSLDREAAAELLVASFTAFERKPLTLPLRVIVPRVTAADLAAVEAELRTALSKPVLLALGPTRYRTARWQIARILAIPADGVRQVKIGGLGADRYFVRLKNAVARPARDARFAVSRNRVRIIPARDALSLDVRATGKNLLATLFSPTRRVAKIVVVSRPAKRTTEEAQKMGIRTLVSTDTIDLGGAGNSVHNARLVARLIDKTLIGPGKTFSFNQSAGARTADRGFELAPVIVNDEVHDGFGGGVCEVATMIFNAAFEAGLDITARTSHSLYIRGYPQGRDAAVDYPNIDLKFVNDTGHWLLLRTFVSSSALTVSLYGTPVHRKVVSETAPLVETGSPPVKRVKDPTLLQGKRVVENPGAPARSTSVRRLVYDQHGRLLHDDVWYSNYRAEPRVIRVGTKKVPPTRILRDFKTPVRFMLGP
jgi:vancomycin resistance protein YoaR